MSTDPVVGYKELLDAAHQAARRHAEHERGRVVAIVGEIVDADKEITAATESAAKVTDEVTGWWRRQVLAPTADLSWITPGALPAPDLTADPAQLADYMAHIEPATEALTAALRRASWPRRR
ncbi:hypothetical protein [Alloactinosynnema sp. L-07]|uniref:hypothetical protein n=1 Tax=Alloactinosynnema sp. L-07 TaxID=1653480 RepID=UPI00065F0397|nr:hypothetical protein [Alloactinosynnema sp. L-07]CRK57490.1 hypothetical protein [Alloactinosynnema sp. L-07]